MFLSPTIVAQRPAAYTQTSVSDASDVEQLPKVVLPFGFRGRYACLMLRLLLPLVAAVGFGALSAQTANVPVFNTNDAFAGSLRQAIQDAPTDSTIVFQIPTSDPRYDPATGRYAVTLTSASLSINKSLTIDAGTQKISIQRSFAGGTPNFQIFKIASGTVTLANVTITNGNASSALEGGGSAVLNYGALTFRNCLIFNNTGGGLGAVYVPVPQASVVISNCTLTQNRAFQNGAVTNHGTMSIDNSTIFGNDSDNGGVGGVRTDPDAPPPQIHNTIIVGNTGNNGTVAADYRGTFTSAGYNLVGTPSAGGFGFNATGDQAGASPAAANLGPLQDNGGPTFTMSLRLGSIAIDQGNRGVDADGQPINTDERGSPRPVDLPATPNAFGGDGSDIGAVETGPTQAGPTFTVTNTAEHTGGCTTDDCTLLEAIIASNANADTNNIIFAFGVGPVIVNQLMSSGYPLATPMNIVGPGARQLAISGGGLWRVFDVTSPNVTISGLSLVNGRQTGANPKQHGGAIYNSGGLTLIDCTIKNNTACNCGSGTAADGGGLYNASGATVTLLRCTFSGNTAPSLFGGGAVFNAGTLTATNCTFTGNTAPAGGAILSLSNNVTTLRNCTITNNTATDTSASTSGGGGYYGQGAVGNSLHRFSNTILAGNVNSQNPDLRGYGTSEGNNIIGNLSPGDHGFSDGVNGDKVGVSAGLNSFGSNGGPTDTWSLLSNSVAIDMGNDALAPATDQRGYPRIGVSDIGAFEFGSANLRVINITRSGNDIVIEFTEAVANNSYRLERKTEISDPTWQPINGLADLTVSTTGSAQITHVGGATAARAFYRVRLLP